MTGIGILGHQLEKAEGPSENLQSFVDKGRWDKTLLSLKPGRLQIRCLMRAFWSRKDCGTPPPRLLPCCDPQIISAVPQG